jgi:hypothetical protein
MSRKKKQRRKFYGLNDPENYFSTRDIRRKEFRAFTEYLKTVYPTFQHLSGL